MALFDVFRSPQSIQRAQLDALLGPRSREALLSETRRLPAEVLAQGPLQGASPESFEEALSTGFFDPNSLEAILAGVRRRFSNRSPFINF